MRYLEAYARCEDMIRRADDNQGTVIISDADITALEEAKIALTRLIGDYPKPQEKN